MNVFTKIKERVSMPEICAMLGITPNRAGFVPCPHHSERTPSCKIYTDSFYCYSCHRGGDAIQLVCDALDISPLVAARRVDSFFNLGLFEENKPIPRKNRSQQSMSVEECDTVYRLTLLDILADCCRAAYKDNSPDFEKIEELHQALLDSNNVEIKDFKRNYGKEVVKYVKKYYVGCTQAF